MKKYLSLLWVVLLVWGSAGGSLAAPPPPYLTYQGHVYDATGAPVADGDYTFEFSLWPTGLAGTQLWGPEAHTLAVSNGYFAVTLGEQAALPTTLPSPVYLEITVNGETLSPRQPLQSVVFALNADRAETAATAENSWLLDGHLPSYYQTWDYTLNIPAGFADGVDNDTIYTDADALAAVAAAGYLTQTGAFTDAQTLNGQPGSYYLSWDNLIGMPADFADGVDNDTLYTDAQAVSAVAGAGYVTTTQVQTLIGTATVTWGQLSGAPAGFADGTDNDTQYTAGTGMSLSGTQFNVTGAPWGGISGLPAGFADGVDNDTVYTDSQAIAAVAGAGYVTGDQVVGIITGTGTLTLTASNAATLDGQDGSYYLAWGNQTGVPAGFADGTDNDTTYSAGSGLSLSGTQFAVTGAPWGGITGVPAGFADGVDNDTVYTDSQAVAAVAGAGYVTSDQVLGIITGTGTLTLTVSYAEAAGGTARLAGQDSSYYLNASNINAGTLGTAYYSAAGDLAAEGYLDNNAATDLLLQGQADGRYVNTGEAGSVTAAMLGDGVTLSELADDDGAGSGLDSDLLDGQSGAYYLAWGNQTGVPAGFADGTDNDTTYSAGTGVSLAGTTFSADTSYVQRRVSSTCAVGSSIRAIAADGTVTCQTDNDTNTTYTAGTGLNLVGTTFSVAPTYQMPQSCTNGQIPAWNGSAWVCAADANAGGDITGVTAGTGLSGGGTTGAVMVSADTTYLQRRVSSTCAAGSSISAIAADGTVTCETDDNTTYTPGAGLTLSGTQFIADTSYLQRRVSVQCPMGSAISIISAAGGVACEADDNTTYSAGTGLNLVGTTFSIATGRLVPNSCNSGEIAQWNGSAWGCAALPAGGSDTDWPANGLVVSQHGGGDFTTIGAAMSSITDATSSKPYVVWVAPGVYNESVPVRSWTTLVGTDRDRVIIQPTSGTYGLGFGDNSAARDVTVRLSVPNTAYALSLTGAPVQLDNVAIQLAPAASYTHYGLYTLGADGTVTVNGLQITYSGAGTSHGVFCAEDPLTVNLRNSTISVNGTAVWLGGGAGLMGTLTADLTNVTASGATGLRAVDTADGHVVAGVQFCRLVGSTASVSLSTTYVPAATLRHTDLSGAISGAPTCVAVTRGTAFGATTCP